jgi:hypothetical protein
MTKAFELNKSFKDGAQYVWDSTSLKMADACPRYYQYKMIFGWDNPSKSFHLTFGMHYATALEHYHKHRALGADSAEALELIVQEALENTWNHSELGEPGPWNSGHHLKNRENLIRSIIWYIDQFEDEEIKTVILEDGKPAVEHSFTLPVDDGLYLAGHLDRLVLYSSENYVMDQKTTGSTLGMYYFNQFSPDMQMSLYTFAGKAIFGIPVKGVIIDAAQVAVGFTRFERGFTFRTEAQLTEWYDNTMQTLENHFPMRLSSCGNYGGCEFRGVCSRSPDVRKNFLAADFKPGWVWDPLERR